MSRRRLSLARLKNPSHRHTLKIWETCGVSFKKSPRVLTKKGKRGQPIFLNLKQFVARKYWQKCWVLKICLKNWRGEKRVLAGHNPAYRSKKNLYKIPR